MKLRLVMVTFLMAVTLTLSTNGQTQTGTPPGCNNDNQHGTTPSCDDPCLTECDEESETPNRFHVFSGDAQRHVRDLEVWGGVGEHQLVWERTGHSRLNEGSKWFGHGHIWQHNYQWELVTAATNKLTLFYPSGTVHTYTYASGTWTGTKSNPDKLTQNGSVFTLTRANGWRYKFTQYTGYYQLDSFLDSLGNVYALTYDANQRLTQVTEPGGRWLRIHYQDIAINNESFVTLAAVTNLPGCVCWQELGVTDANSYRYLRYYTGGEGTLDNYNMIGEVEFYDVNTNKLSGVPFGTSPAYATGQEYDKAFDGNTTTKFRYAYSHFGFTGIDLGAGNAQRISKVRYLPPSGMPNWVKDGKFQGANVAPATVTVIASVETSDGRSVTYHYTTIPDPVLEQDWVVLSSVSYGDGTAAAYNYVVQWPGQRPLMVEANDPRVSGTGTHMKYEYWQQSWVYGAIYQERNGVDNTVLAKLEGADNKGYASNASKVTYGNGAVKTYSHASSGITNRVDALGRESKYTYGNNGAGFRLTSKDALGRTTTYTRDSQGRPGTITYPDGSSVKWTYNSLGKPLTYSNELGRVTRWTYDASNRVTRVDYPDSAYETWTYNNFGQPLTHRGKNGGVEEWSYGPTGLKLTYRDAAGAVTSYAYHTNDLLAAVTDARGNTTQYTYNERGQVVSVQFADNSVRTMAYDSYGNKTNEVDELGHATSWTYDEFKRVTSVTDALGRTTIYSYNEPGGAGCGCSSGGANHPTVIQLPSGKTTEFTYDQEWQKTSEVTGVGTPDEATTQYQYDAAGNLVATIDPRGHTWSSTYDSRNRKITARDPLGNTSTFSYDARGNRVRQIDANNKYTYWTYDDNNRVLDEIRKVGDTNPTPDGNDAVTSYNYDLAGNVLSVADPNGNGMTYTYDLLNRRRSAVNSMGETTLTGYDAVGNVTTNVAPNGSVTLSIYDNRNRLVQMVDSVGFVAQTSYDAAGRRTSQTDGNGNTISFGYDAANQLVATTDALNQTAQNQYDLDGNLIQVTDRQSQVTTYTYDGLNRRKTMTDALGNVTQFFYDAAGNQVAITDANGHTTSYLFDNANRKTRETYADGGIVNYTYDGTGHVLTKTDQKGQVTTYSYNDLYYLLQRSVPGFPADTFTYDVGGRMLTATRNGWVVTYSYDAANRVLQTTQGGQTIGYAYNVATGTRTITYPSGRVIVEQKDLRDRLVTVSDTGGVIAQYSYDLGNRVGTRAYRNGVVASYTYDADNRILSLSHVVGQAPPLAAFAHSYDAEGNKLYEQKLHQPGNSEAYAYDNDYRLTDYRVGTLSGNTVPSPTTESAWNLDPVGNWNSRTTDTNTETRTHSAANAITGIDATAIVSDANGNLTADATQAYDYDEANRLIRVTRLSDNAVLGEYSYDALGRRISKNTAAGATCFFYDGARIIEEQACSGGTQATYTYGNYVDEVLTRTTNPGSPVTYYYHQNTLWSVYALTDSAGNVVERYSYDPYGKLTVMDAAFSTLNTPPSTPFTFTGREFDAESGLYHYRARIYGPAVGRFFQRDPAGYVDGMNLYEYVRGNPVAFLDPFGEGCLEDAAQWRAQQLRSITREYEYNRDEFLANEADIAQAEIEARFYRDTLVTVATAGAGAIARGVATLVTAGRVTRAARLTQSAISMAREGQASINMINRAAVAQTAAQAAQNTAITIAEQGTRVAVTAATALNQSSVEQAASTVTAGSTAGLDPSSRALVAAARTTLNSLANAADIEARHYNDVPGIAVAAQRYRQQLNQLAEAYAARVRDCCP